MPTQDNAKEIEKILVDTITENPICFELSGRFFYLYPPSLGVSMLSTRYLKELSVNKELMAIDNTLEMLRLAHEKRSEILHLIAMHTFKRRSDILNEDMMRERLSQFQELTVPELVALLLPILDWQSWHDKLIKHFNLDKEAQQRAKINDFKNKDRSSVTFGGRSVFGSLLDYTSERYGWQVGYTVWGISIITLNMMLADSITTMYLSKEERQKMNVSTDGIYINADDPASKKLIASMFGKRAPKSQNKQTTNREEKVATNRQKQPNSDENNTKTTTKQARKSKNSAKSDQNNAGEVTGKVDK